MLEDGKRRVRVRPAHPLAAVPVRRPGRAVHDRAHARWRRARACRTSVPAPSPTATGSWRRAAAPAGPSRSAASTSTRRSWPRTSSLLSRIERRDRIVRDLEAQARRIGGRALLQQHPQAEALLEEVPDLVEFPAVVAGAFSAEFLDAARGSADDDADSSPALLSRVGDERRADAGVSGRHEHADEQRAGHRDQRRARGHGAAARRALLLGRRPARSGSRRGSTGSRPCCSTSSSGRYRAKAARLEALARLDCDRRLRARRTRPTAAGAGGAAGQGGPGDRHGAGVHRAAGHDGRHLRARGRRARGGLEGDLLPLPARSASRPTRAPTRAALGAGAVTWAAVSLADKLDTLVGLFLAGERPTGSRDPFGLRRQAHGVLRILVDAETLTGVHACARPLGALVDAGAWPVRRRGRPMAAADGARRSARVSGRAAAPRVRVARAPIAGTSGRSCPVPDVAMERAGGRPARRTCRRCRSSRSRSSSGSWPPRSSASGTSRASIRPDVRGGRGWRRAAGRRARGAGRAGAARGNRRAAAGDRARGRRVAAASATRTSRPRRFEPVVATFFDDVFVMSDDLRLRQARLRLLKRLEIGDSAARGYFGNRGIGVDEADGENRQRRSVAKKAEEDRAKAVRRRAAKKAVEARRTAPGRPARAKPAKARRSTSTSSAARPTATAR